MTGVAHGVRYSMYEYTSRMCNSTMQLYQRELSDCAVEIETELGATANSRVLYLPSVWWSNGGLTILIVEIGAGVDWGRGDPNNGGIGEFRQQLSDSPQIWGMRGLEKWQE